MINEEALSGSFFPNIFLEIKWKLILQPKSYQING